MFSLLCLAALWVYSRINSKSRVLSSLTLYSRQVDFPIFPNLILCTVPLFQLFTLPRLEVGSSHLTHQNVNPLQGSFQFHILQKYRHSLLSLVFVFLNFSSPWYENTIKWKVPETNNLWVLNCMPSWATRQNLKLSCSFPPSKYTIPL